MLDLGLRNGEVVRCSSRTLAEIASRSDSKSKCGNGPAVPALSTRAIALLKAIQHEQLEKAGIFFYRRQLTYCGN